MATVDSLVQRAAELLNDPNHERWTYANLIEWVNAGVASACKVVPQLYTKKVDLTLVEGAIQALPAEYTLFIRGYYTKIGGATIGKTPINSELGSVTLIDPNWMSGTPANEIDEIMYDVNTLHTFLVNPPQPAGTTNTLYAEVGAAPPFALPNEAIPIPLVFETAIVDYVLFRAYSMDAEHASQDGRAAVHYNTFKAALLGR